MALVQLSMNVPQHVMDDARAIADERSCTVTKVIRDGIAMDEWIRDATKDGQRLIITDDDGSNERELVIRR